MKPIIGEMQREIWMSIVEPERLKGLIDRGQQLALDADILLELLRMPIRERMKIFEDFSASRFGASSRVNFLTDDFVGYPNMLREWYADTVYLPFENMAVPAPAAYESLLSCLYGDYMTPAQIPNMHEGIFLDPDASYTQYMNKEGV